MSKGRLEAFSDGVIAIIITIMVLELKVPHGADWAALQPLLPVFLSYVLSFVYLGIYWNNHHHMLHAAERVSGGILWANLHLLFWLSLIPFVTGWMGENHFAPLPTALYGVVLLHGRRRLSDPAARSSSRRRGRARRWPRRSAGTSRASCRWSLYALAIPLAFVNQWISDALYVAVALMWLIPDRRIEKSSKRSKASPGSRPRRRWARTTPNRELAPRLGFACPRLGMAAGADTFARISLSSLRCGRRRSVFLQATSRRSSPPA